MTIGNVFIEFFYEFKRSCRNVIFRVFIFLGIVGVVVYSFTSLSQSVHMSTINDFFRLPPVDWVSQALPSSIPLKCAYLFNILQLLFVVALVVNDSRLTRLDAMDALRVHAQGNAEIVAGNIVGKLLAFTMINVLSFVFCAFLNFLFYPSVFNLGYYFFYGITLNLPTLVFCLGITSLVTRMIEYQGVRVLVLFIVFGGLVLPGAHWLNGLLDPFASNIPNIFSDFTGHVNLESYLLQRLFILSVGCGSAVLAVIPYPRIPNRIRARSRLMVVALLPFALAVVFAFSYLWEFHFVEKKREAYREAYAKYAGEVSLKIIENHLHVQEMENGGISVVSRMNVVNVDSVSNPFVFYLNPGLEVSSVSVDGENVDFHRDQQVLLFNGELASKDTCEIVVSYEGGIDNSLCFLDTPADKFDSPDVNRIGMYHFGYTPAFCEKGYKLLTPECVWFPVSVPSYDSVEVRRMMFARYFLEVVHDPALMAISQGCMVDRTPGKTTFTFTHDMPGISLCIGHYKRREVIIDSTRMELFYAPAHEFMLDCYDRFPAKELLERLKEAKGAMESAEINGFGDYYKKRRRGEVAFDATLQYPYRWLTLVEVPCDFHCFARRTRLTGERVQEGMVFLPEKKYSEEDVFVYRGEYEVETQLHDDLSMFKKFGSYDLHPTFVGNTIFIHSVEYPVINDAFIILLNDLGDARIMSEEEEYAVVDYLKNRSLEEALQDFSLPAGLLDNIIYKKSKELGGFIVARVGGNEFYRFCHDFLVQHLFEETTFEKFSREFYARFDVGLDSIVEGWYHGNSLPAFDISGRARFKKGDILYNFNVFNRGKISGVVKLCDNQAWIIPPGEGRTIKALVYRAVNFNVETTLALNLPASVSLPVVEENVYIDTTLGIFPLDPSLCTTENDNEIIVDDSDSGFKILETRKFSIASLLGISEPRHKYYSFSPPDHWGRTIRRNCYGFPVRGAVFKQAAKGNQKVQWEARLPKEGKYEVFCYQPLDDRSLYNTFLNFSRKYYYTVFDGQEEQEVVLEMDKDEWGWVSLGVFDFHGNARITLSDRDRDHDPHNKSYSPQDVVADAMKWVPVRE